MLRPFFPFDYNLCNFVIKFVLFLPSFPFLLSHFFLFLFFSFLMMIYFSLHKVFTSQASSYQGFSWVSSYQINLFFGSRSGFHCRFFVILLSKSVLFLFVFSHTLQTLVRNFKDLRKLPPSSSEMFRFDTLVCIFSSLPTYLFKPGLIDLVRSSFQKFNPFESSFARSGMLPIDYNLWAIIHRVFRLFKINNPTVGREMHPFQW